MIIIENDTVPKSCYDCPFNVGEYTPDEYEKRHCDLTGKSTIKTDYDKKPKACPLNVLFS